MFTLGMCSNQYIFSYLHYECMIPYFGLLLPLYYTITHYHVKLPWWKRLLGSWIAKIIEENPIWCAEAGKMLCVFSVYINNALELYFYRTHVLCWLVFRQWVLPGIYEQAMYFFFSYNCLLTAKLLEHSLVYSLVWIHFYHRCWRLEEAMRLL